MMIDRLGQRMADFVGTTGAKMLRAVEGVVPGVEPPRHRRVTPGRVVMAVGAAAAAVAINALRDVVERSGSSAGTRSGGAGSSSTNGRKSSGSSSGSKASRKATQAKDEAADLAGKTRAELYELAQKADIEGRSSMSKDALVKALKKATPS